MRDELVGKSAVALLSSNTKSGSELKKVVIVSRAESYDGKATYKVAVLDTKDQDFRYVNIDNLTIMRDPVEWSEVVAFLLYEMFETWGLSKFIEIARSELTCDDLDETDWFPYSGASYKSWASATTEHRIAYIIYGRWRSGQEQDCD